MTQQLWVDSFVFTEGTDSADSAEILKLTRHVLGCKQLIKNVLLKYTWLSQRG